MFKTRLFRVVCLAALLTASGFVTASKAGAAEADPEVSAYLDGRPISVSEVSKHYCDDFSFPVIQCSSLALGAHVRSLLATAVGVDYATIYDYPYYGGGFMHVSQDYTALLLVGWNDKISSFKGRNSESGRFWTNWFGGGTLWGFCCNQNVGSLGQYNNTFSSMHRT